MLVGPIVAILFVYILPCICPASLHACPQQRAAAPREGVQPSSEVHGLRDVLPHAEADPPLLTPCACSPSPPFPDVWSRASWRAHAQMEPAELMAELRQCGYTVGEVRDCLPHIAHFPGFEEALAMVYGDVAGGSRCLAWSASKPPLCGGTAPSLPTMPMACKAVPSWL